MNNYIIQNAQKALESLASPAPWEERLREAKSQFLKIQDVHLQAPTPEDVRVAILKLLSCDELNLPHLSMACQEAIETVFQAAGRMDAFGAENQN